jgi:predicted nuclease with TOPRIM domain
MDLIGSSIIGIAVGLVVAIALRMQKQKNTPEEDEDKTLELEKSISSKEEIIKNLQSKKNILDARMESFEKLKTENTTLKEKLSNTENERNQLKTKNTTLEKEEENRIKEFKKAIDSTNTLQESLEKEKERLNDERVKEKEAHFNNMKKQWREHEKDVENHLQMICKNNVIT